MNEPLRPQGAHTTRRGFVIAGGVAVVAGGTAGVLVGRSTTSTKHDPLVAHVSAELGDAAVAEQRLIAGVDVALRSARGARRTRLRQVRAGHVAHLAAIEGAIDAAIYPATRSPSASPSGSGSVSAPAPVQPASGSVASAEQKASVAAAARALRLTGNEAVLLATIAAAEAAHAELLKGAT